MAPPAQNTDNVRVNRDLLVAVRVYQEEHKTLPIQDVTQYLERRGYQASRPQIEAAIMSVTMDLFQAPSRAKHK